MRVQLTQESKYAMRALVYLARQQPGRHVPIREIQRGAEVPGPFLAKILTRLSRSGLLSTRRGPLGGAALTRPANEIVLGDVVDTLEGRCERNACYLGFGMCDSRRSCPLHAVWHELVDELERTMRRCTLADLRHVGPAPGLEKRTKDSER